MNDQDLPDTRGIGAITFDDIVSQSKVESGKELSTTRIGYRLAILLLRLTTPTWRPILKSTLSSRKRGMPFRRSSSREK